MAGEIPFTKFQGTGNDFIIIDQFDSQFLHVSDQERIARLCDRRFGIGADGLILLETSQEQDFKMLYFNADGKLGSLCGNGSRCAVACMAQLGRFGSEGSFEASDGIHSARYFGADHVEVQMHRVSDIEQGKGHVIMDTGSPHYVTFVEDLSDLDIVEAGRVIRYSSRFALDGINVNFVERSKAEILVATYERGVEDETLSCGTGITAAALASEMTSEQGRKEVNIRAKGGSLSVRFNKLEDETFDDIWLCGPAQRVFTGSFED